MRLTVSPERGLIDEPLVIRLDGLEPGAEVTVRARLSGYGGSWTSSATFVADASGCIEIDRDAPISGSYTGVRRQSVCSGR